MKKGYLRQSDYTKKTQSMAEQRKEAETLASNAEAKAMQLVQDRFQMVGLDVEKRLKDYQQVDWKALSRTNPNDYTALKADYDECVQEAQTIEREFRGMQAQQQELQQAQQQEAAKQSYAILNEEVPGWGKELYSNMMTYAVESGMPEDVVSNIVDSSALKMIYKAYMFDKSKNELKANVKPKDKPSVKSRLKPKAKIDLNPEQVTAKKVDKLRSNIKSATSKTDINAAQAALVARLL